MNTYLQIFLTINTNVSNNSIVVFNNIETIEGNISYDLNSGNIVILEEGTYLVNWYVSGLSCNSKNTKFVLRSNIDNIANSYSKANQIIGMTLLNCNENDMIRLINESGNTFYYDVDSEIKANLVIYKLNEQLINDPSYINIMMNNLQALEFNDLINFNGRVISNNILYDPTLNLFSLINPGVYEISLVFFGNPNVLSFNNISNSDFILFNLPTGYGIKTINFIYEITESSYVGFLNPTNDEFIIGIDNLDNNGSIVIKKLQ